MHSLWAVVHYIAKKYKKTLEEGAVELPDSCAATGNKLEIPIWVKKRLFFL